MSLDQLAVITPSRIESQKRFDLASASFQSLQSMIGEEVPHYVVHDRARHVHYVPKLLHPVLSAARWDLTAEQIYSSGATYIIRRVGRGSASALSTAITAAMTDGMTFGFIHLDDQVYSDDFRSLLSHGLDAMTEHPDLLWVRFSGYPIMCNDRPELQVIQDRIRFDGIELTPNRVEDYTLWSSPLTLACIDGRYWPVAMWFCIYRLEELGQILSWAREGSMLHLAHVERHLKQPEGFKRLLQAYPNGKFGYINMQYGGIEMHRNANWKGLLQLPNAPIH
jgi:hypothetical protein